MNRRLRARFLAPVAAALLAACASGAPVVQTDHAPGVDFTKALPVTGGDKAYVVEFSREELQAMFGKTVTFTFFGPVSTPGAISVTPSQAVQIGTRFELTVSSNS